MPSTYLRRYLAERPVHLAILRAAECELYQSLTMEGPVLDVGSGDGFFAHLLFDHPIDAAIDFSWKYMREAKRTGAYRNLQIASCTALPYPSGHFGTVMSNSVLEHIPDLMPSLQEIHRVLRERGSLVFTVPCGDYTEQLLGTRLFKSLRLRSVAGLYGAYFTRISRHHHYLPADTWIERLEHVGFEVIHHCPYFSRKALYAFDVAHWFGYASFIWKLLLGRWVLWPGKIDILPLERWLAPYARSNGGSDGTYLFFICRKRSR